MATILLRVPVDSEPKTAYEAVATTQGVNGWWSNHTQGPAGVGSTMKVGLPDAPVTFDFEVTDETPESRIRWHCIAGPPEWIGTDISFDVQTDDDGQTSVAVQPRRLADDQGVVPVHRLLVGPDPPAVEEAGREWFAESVLRLLAVARLPYRTTSYMVCAVASPAARNGPAGRSRNSVGRGRMRWIRSMRKVRTSSRSRSHASAYQTGRL